MVSQRITRGLQRSLTVCTVLFLGTVLVRGNVEDGFRAVKYFFSLGPADGLDGMRFIAACVASSQADGAWTVCQGDDR